MKRKVAAIFMVAILVLSMAVMTGCGNKANDNLNQTPDADQNLTNDGLHDDGLDDDRLNDNNQTNDADRNDLGSDIANGADDLGDDIRDGADDVKNGVEDVLDGNDNRNNQ